MKERLLNTGGEEAFMNREEFTKFLAADQERWARVAQAIRK